MDKQSFRAQLVEWFREIIPYGNLDKYIRKTREGIDTNPHCTDRHANHVHYVIYTKQHSYGISATPTYLGCIASTMYYRPGENWTRGNDLPDGPFSRETWEAIKDRIIGYELQKLEPLPSYGDCAHKCPPAAAEWTPEEAEYNEARYELLRAQQRMEKAEHVRSGLFKKDEVTPCTRAAVEPELEVDALVEAQLEPLMCDNDLCRGADKHHLSCPSFREQEILRRNAEEQSKRKPKVK